MKNKQIKKDINLMCPIGGDPIGLIGLNVLRSFRDIDIRVSLFPIMTENKLSFNSPSDADICAGALKHSRNFLYKSPILKIWHPHDLATKPGNGVYHTLIVPDSDNLTSSEVHHLNYVDNIFVTSNWALDIVRKHKINTNISKINLGVDNEIFSPKEAPRNNENYIFYSTGRWSMSNGYDFLIKAFSLAFEKTDKVELRLIPYNEFLTEKENNFWLSLVDNSNLKDKIFLFNRLQTQYDLADFISYSDCLVATQRVCSTGMSILEAMSMNKHIIATNTGAALDYANGGFQKIDISSYEQAYDNRVLYGESNWAKLGSNELDQTIELMRNAYKNNIKNNLIGFETAKGYSWRNTANSIEKIIFQPKKKKETGAGV